MTITQIMSVRTLVRLLDVSRLAAVRAADADAVKGCTQVVQALQEAKFDVDLNDAILGALTIIEAYVDTRKEV